MIIKKNVLVFCDDSEEHSIDLARIIEKSLVINIPIVLFQYRKHKSQFTSNYDPTKNIYLQNMHQFYCGGTLLLIFLQSGHRFRIQLPLQY